MRLTLLTITCLFSGVLQVKGQPLPANISFDHITIPGTIRSSEVSDIVQDPEGVLWLASDGLYRYDGKQFTRYTELEDSGSIANNEINSLFYDKVKNRLLIATRSHGAVEYRYETNSLRKIPSKVGPAVVNHFAQTQDGKIWASSFNNNLLYIENDTLKAFSRRFTGGSTTALCAMGKKILIAELGKVFILENNVITDSLVLSWPGVIFHSFARVTALALDKKNNLYIGTEKQGMLVYDNTLKSFVKYFSPETEPFYNRINRIFVDRSSLVWILTKSGGLAIYSPGAEELMTVQRDPFSPGTLSGDDCRSIIEDQTGILWVGATGDLNTYNPGRIRFTHITYNPYDKNSLTDKMVRGVFEDDEGFILVGTDGGFINRINPSTKAVEHIKVTLPGHKGIITPIWFLEFDQKHIMVCTNIGAILMDKKTRQFSVFEPLQPDFEDKVVRQAVRHNDKLYIISAGKFYVHDLISRTTKGYTNFSPNRGRGISNATCLYIDKRGRLWVGENQGLSRLNDDDTFTHYQFEKNTSRPIGSYFMVLSIQEIEGKFWVGTFDSGLWQMSLDENSNEANIRQLERPEQWMSKTVYATLPDDEGNIWLSTNQGILKYEPGTDRFIPFYNSEGVQDLEFNRLAYHKTRAGHLVFGGVNGVNIFDPKQISINSTLCKPNILSLAVNPEEENAQYADLRHRPSVRVGSNQKVIRFEYIIPDYRHPVRFETEYFLENYDSRWNSTSSNQVSFANLKPGDYVFKVRVKNQEGLEEIASLALIIEPPLWQTWWFISLALGFAVVGAYAGMKAYTAKTVRDPERLEQLLRLRTREIERSRAELEDLNQKKDLIFSILSHDLRGPLTTLKGFLSLIIDNTDTLAKEDIKKYANNIRNSVTSSLDLIDNTLFWSLSQTGNITYSPTDFPLQDTLTKIHRLYQLTADHKGIRLDVDIDKDLKVHADQNMMYVALRNIVSNALKFTPDGRQVSIRAYKNHEHAVIKVKDEGIGMSSSYLEKLLSDDFPTLKTGTSNEKGTGLGLVLCKKFIAMNQGKLSVESEEKKGSEFTITIPLSILNGNGSIPAPAEAPHSPVS